MVLVRECSLGGKREQDLVSLGGWWHPEKRFIRVVYQDWIEECLAYGKVIPVAGHRAVRWVWGEGTKPCGKGYHTQLQIR